jgi:phosphatidate cytidylyltransferase
MYPRGSNYWAKSTLMRGIIGVFVLVPCWLALNYIRNQSDGIYALLFLLILIWGADTTAYFVGKKFGRTKLAPQVSPGKTVVGLYAALICTFIIACIALLICQIPLRFWFGGILISLITVFFSIIGDLTESMLKRAAKLKDSGQILPGHGGLLDRIDSLTAAAPIFVSSVLIFSSLMSQH